jgi:hypothetical protein
MVLEQILTLAGLASADVIAVTYLFAYLFRKKNFTGKYVDVKEAPLSINNTLKDDNKRMIIRTLKHEKKYLTLIAQEVGQSVAKTMYHLKELERMGIIGSMKLSREKFFLLTRKGQWCLDAIHTYYPQNNFEKITSALRIGILK